MIDDPIVAEVRAIREQLAAQSNFDIRKIVEEARQRQSLAGLRVVSFARPRPSTPPRFCAHRRDASATITTEEP